MANFYLHLQQSEIATQIADMLNKYNMLSVRHSAYTVTNSNLDYYIETAPGVHKSMVVGCIGTEDFSWGRKVRHLCVLPAFRRNHIANRLIQTASNINGPVFADIRVDNVPSINLFLRNGFVEIGRKQLTNTVIIFRRN